MDPSAAGGRRAAVRRAAAFGVVLLTLGTAAIALRILHVDLHPQILLFLYSIPANSAVSVFSHEVALLDYGRQQPLLLTTLSATAGTVAAAFLDWRVFVPLLDGEKIASYRRHRLYRWSIDRFSRAPFLALVIAGFTPIPFVPFKFLAFSVKYPLTRYLAAVTVARAPRYLLLAWIGCVVPVPKWALLLLFLLILVLVLASRLRTFPMREGRTGP